MSLLALAISSSTYFHPGLHFIMNVKFELAKLLFNNAFVIRERGQLEGVRPNKQKNEVNITWSSISRSRKTKGEHFVQFTHVFHE